MSTVIDTPIAVLRLDSRLNAYCRICDQLRPCAITVFASERYRSICESCVEMIAREAAKEKTSK